MPPIAENVLKSHKKSCACGVRLESVVIESDQTRWDKEIEIAFQVRSRGPVGDVCDGDPAPVAFCHGPHGRRAGRVTPFDAMNDPD